MYASAVGVAAVRTATNLEADCIVTPTMSGQTARLMAHLPPENSRSDACQLAECMGTAENAALNWGVTPLRGYQEGNHRATSFPMQCTLVKREGYVREGDMVVFTAGDPATNMVKGKGAMTNMMHVIQAK